MVIKGVSKPDAVASVEAESTPPIKIMAFFGVLLSLFMAYVWGKWITGPNFKRVEPGPTQAPDWMIFALQAFEIGGVLLAGMVIWRCLIRPWRRDGRPSTDGLLVIGFATVWFQDPFSTYYVNWFTYNTNLINFGSWVQDVPGWVSYGSPGHTIAEPIVFIGPSYVYFLMLGVLFGSWVMRTLRKRWPKIQAWQQLIVCFVAMCALDLVAEGLIWMPLGFWSYPGGHGILFPSTYHKFALEEMIPIGLMFTGLSALRYFRDDKGQMMVERGADKISGQGRQTIARILAMVAVAQVIFFVTYNGPAMLVAAAAHEWPKDVQQRSYFTNYVCGDQTDRACPGHGVPITRSTDSAYLTPDGQLRPGTAPLPQPVPFDTTPTSAGK